MLSLKGILLRGLFWPPLPGQLWCTTAPLFIFCAAALIVPLVQGSSHFGLGTTAVNSSLNDVSTPHTLPNEKLLEKVIMLAYRGNVRALRSLVEQHRSVDWNAALANAQMIPIHYALQGRHDTLSQQPANLIGQHEEVVSYLTTVAHFNATQGCAVYYAMHYRNMKALEVLLRTGNKEQSITCLTALDSTGETALHSAAKSKASGFARLFASVRKNEDVLDLLGLQVLKILGTQILTLESLNSVITHQDIQMVLKFLQPALNVSLLVDQQGNTLLHNAAYGGRMGLVKFLISAHVPLNSKNHFGLTPLDLSCAGHFCNVAELLAAHGARRTWSDEECKCKDLVTDLHKPPTLGISMNGSNAVFEPDRSQRLLLQRYVDSGWISPQGAAAAGYHDCGIDVRNSSLSPENFLSWYKSTHKPLVIQGLTVSWSAWKHWTKTELVKRYGGLKFTVSSIPYAEVYYGAEAETSTATLAKYVSHFGKSKPYPGYIFDGQILHRHSQLAHDVPVPALFKNFTVVLKQFILGPTGSGAPPHFHRHAFNALVYGIKRWYLWPPSEAYFSFSHVQQWQHEYLAGRLTTPPAIECVQRPGDIVYVPENWGHAVVNLADSVAVAYEFQ